MCYSCIYYTFSIFFYLVFWWFWWKADKCSHHIFNKIFITWTNQSSDLSTGILAWLFPCTWRKRVDTNGRDKKSKKRHPHVSNVFPLRVSAHSIVILTQTSNQFQATLSKESENNVLALCCIIHTVKWSSKNACALHFIWCKTFWRFW